MPWSYKAGERGVNRVRVAEDLARHGKLFVEFRADGRKVRQYLTHKDKSRAKQQCDELAAKLRTVPAASHARETLGALLDLYLREVTPQRRHTADGRQHNHTAAALFIRAWGAERKPQTIGLREWDRFIAERRSGRLRPPGKKRKEGSRPATGPVRDTQVGYDLKFIMSVFKWATMAGDGAGGVLLDRNPCAGFPIPTEQSPARPRISVERYAAMLAVAPDVDPQFALALVLCNETGHRLSSVRQLRWSDVRWADKAIMWRSDSDKQRTAHTTPLTSGAFRALEAARPRLLALSDTPVFLDESGESMRSRSTFAKWWRRAETLAELDPSPRMGWHALRRKFATEMKDAPLSDLMELGGWKSSATLQKCYIAADVGTMRRALGRRRAITDEKKEEAM
jgi:hypothetical protein